MDEQSTPLPSEPAPVAPGPNVGAEVVRLTVLFEPRNLWRAGLLLVALLAFTAFGKFILDDGGSVIFTLLMAWFASIAMEPAVARLARRMKRGLATGVVMASVGLFGLVFAVLFGHLLVTQLVELVKAIPGLAQSLLDWVNHHLGSDLSVQDALGKVGLTPSKLAEVAGELAGGLLGIVASVFSAFFSMFTLLLFTFYFSADAPRLRRWTARLFPPRYQDIVVTVWDLAVAKTGGYVAARVILAAINGGTTALFLWIIGMPYWLPLGIWTGVVAQFVPTVGTYIAIILPVVVGLLGPEPIQGVLALAWGVGYQQVENLTLEPQISAKAVDVHPAVSFAAVMFGAALFGPAGALLAVPVAALLLALLDIYARKYELLPSLAGAADATRKSGEEADGRMTRGRHWVTAKLARKAPEAPAEAPPG